MQVIEDWIVKRNKTREKIATVSHHRLWQACDAGTAIYQGRRCIGDGLQVLLLRRGDEIIVKPSSSHVVAKASTLKIGQTVHLDKRGRFVNKDSGIEL